LTSAENFTEIVSGEPFRWELNSRGVAKYGDFGPVEGYISVDFGVHYVKVVEVTPILSAAEM